MVPRLDAAPPLTADRGAGRQGRVIVGVVFVVVWGLITHGTFAGSGDEPHYAMIAHSLAFDADLDVSNNYADATLIGAGSLQPEAHARWQDGKLRPVHDVGMPLVFAPVVAIAYPAAEWLAAALPERVLAAARLNGALIFRHQISLVMAFVTGLLARELFLLLRRVNGPGRGIVLWAILFALTPPVLAHSFLFFTEIPTALVTLLVFRRLSAEHVVRAPVALASLGGLTGGLWLLHARNAGLVAGLCILAVLRGRDGRLSPRALAGFLGAVAAVMAVRTAVTYSLWGTLLTTPHATLGAVGSPWLFALDVFVRASGLLLDREHGLFAYGPVYLLALPGLILLARGRDRLALDVCIVLGAYLLPILLPLTNVHGWSGGWSPAARFLVPVAALLWIGVHQYAQRAVGPGKGVVAALVAVQVAINAFTWQFPRVLWNDGDGVSAMTMTQWLPTWALPEAAPLFAVALGAAALLGYWLLTQAPKTAASGVGSP